MWSCADVQFSLLPPPVCHSIYKLNRMEKLKSIIREIDIRWQTQEHTHTMPDQYKRPNDNTVAHKWQQPNWVECLKQTSIKHILHIAIVWLCNRGVVFVMLRAPFLFDLADYVSNLQGNNSLRLNREKERHLYEFRFACFLHLSNLRSDYWSLKTHE